MLKFELFLAKQKDYECINCISNRIFDCEYDFDTQSASQVLTVMTEHHRQMKRFIKMYNKYVDAFSNEKAYRYLLTFTLKPEAVSKSEQAQAWLYKQAERRDTLGIRLMFIARETTKKNVPHWHVVIETSKPLKADRFHYYRSLYGYVDLSRTKAQTIQEALNYISKESAPVKLV